MEVIIISNGIYGSPKTRVYIYVGYVVVILPCDSDIYGAVLTESRRKSVLIVYLLDLRNLSKIGLDV